MATTHGRTSDSVTDSVGSRLLGGQEYRFSFFQAVRLIDLLFSKESGQRTGYGAFPEAEPLRFQARVSMAFPPSELYALGFDPEDSHQFDKVTRTPRNLDPRRPQLPLQMTVNFFGLFGPKGVLPLHYTDMVMRRTRIGDRSLRDFLDLLGNRFLAFLYRAWAKHHVAVNFEWAGRQNRDADSVRQPQRRVQDDFSRYLRSLIGLGIPSLSERLSVRDEVFQYYSGIFAQQRRPALSLRRLLTEHFELPESAIHVEEYVPQVLPLPRTEQSQVGEDNCELGISTVLGDEVLLEASKFELRLGPMDLLEFRRFLPPQQSSTGGSFRRLVEMIRLYVGPEFDFDIRLVLRRESAYSCQLGADEASAAVLGVAAWLLNAMPSQDLADSVFPSSLVEAQG